MKFVWIILIGSDTKSEIGPHFRPVTTTDSFNPKCNFVSFTFITNMSSCHFQFQEEMYVVTIDIGFLCYANCKKIQTVFLVRIFETCLDLGRSADPQTHSY